MWSLRTTRTTLLSLRTMAWSLRTGGHFKKVVVKKDLTVIIYTRSFCRVWINYNIVKNQD